MQSELGINIWQKCMHPFALCKQKLEATVTVADILTALERACVTCSKTHQLLHLSEFSNDALSNTSTRRVTGVSKISMWHFDHAFAGTELATIMSSASHCYRERKTQLRNRNTPTNIWNTVDQALGTVSYCRAMLSLFYNTWTIMWPNALSLQKKADIWIQCKDIRSGQNCGFFRW